MIKQGVFTFGDRLPEGNEDDIFISYKDDEIPGGMLCGPYTSDDDFEAEIHDIIGFGGKDVKLVTRKQLKVI